MAACDAFQYENYGITIPECARMTGESPVDPIDLDITKLRTWQLSTTPSCIQKHGLPIPAKVEGSAKSFHMVPKGKMKNLWEMIVEFSSAEY